mmetsp:Transcript_22613/g.52725  ORF Transcript_22613/g.52725 Transcript_22613/m.52725 type:complete len:526 (+) Transcript_22613:97-1674(+)
MVVLSVAITASGKTLVARQFAEMTRLRVEGLLSAFPKLIESGRDHTFIETETVRYVYQPMETLYLVLVTNRSSNILEDLETLRLLAKVVQDCCQIQVTEELVLKHAFDIVFAFDEVISFGHRESVTLSQIKTYTEMDSHEEKLHQMIEQSKINEARETAKKKQQELAKIRANQPKEPSSMGGGGGGGSMPGLGPSFQDTMPSSSGGGMSMDAPSPSPAWSPSMNDDVGLGGPTIKANAPKKGMMLGKKKPGDMLAGLGVADAAPAPSEAAEPAAEAAPVMVNPLLDPVGVSIEEKITANMQLEGGLVGEAVCVGEFQVTVLDAAKADLVCFKLAKQDPEFKYKVHPSLNKASHASNVLEVRDGKPYKANQPQTLIKWRGASTDESYLPISFSCWPNPTADSTNIVLEFELTDDSVSLEDVHVRFPAAPSARASIASAEPGEAWYDAAAQQVHWHIPVIDSSEGTGTLEFNAAADTASLMPYTFDAKRSGTTKCPMEITECYHQERKEAIEYSCTKTSVYSITVGM